jgi:hypothetical protein
MQRDQAVCVCVCVYAYVCDSVRVCVCARAVSLCCCFIVFVYLCRIFCAMQDESYQQLLQLSIPQLHTIFNQWYQIAGQNEQEALQHLGCAS